MVLNHPAKLLSQRAVAQHAHQGTGNAREASSRSRSSDGDIKSSQRPDVAIGHSLGRRQCSDRQQVGGVADCPVVNTAVGRHRAGATAAVVTLRPPDAAAIAPGKILPAPLRITPGLLQELRAALTELADGQEMGGQRNARVEMQHLRSGCCGACLRLCRLLVRFWARTEFSSTAQS